eukprot:7145121-Prymnesium_polylepis.3
MAVRRSSARGAATRLRGDAKLRGTCRADSHALATTGQSAGPSASRPPPAAGAGAHASSASRASRSALPCAPARAMADARMAFSPAGYAAASVALERPNES